MGDVQQLSWFWIGLELTIVPVVGVLLAFPLWRRDQPIFGSIAGTAVIFGSAVALILREYVQLDRATRACLDAGYTCWPNPGFFTRFALYAFVGLVEVFGLFWLSLVVEERMRRQNYSREWRR
jgi:hypothetical protein